MCGRVTRQDPARLHAELQRLAAWLDDGTAATLREPRYNVPPSDSQLVVRDVVREDGEDVRREATFLRWGLVPFWAKDTKIGNQAANARCETAADKPMYRDAMKRRRCLLVVDGFYEWRQPEQPRGRKQPFHIRMADGAPFLIAGLWERWKPKGEPEAPVLETCTLLTTGPNALMAPIHDRMLVIIGHDNVERWLDPAVRDAAAVADLLHPYPPEMMAAYPVSTIVNSPATDDGRCVAPLAHAEHA